ncbi:Glutaredoxin domain-containing cysteine-rich protein 1 [Sarracenia purpurea var. burkii]
MESYQKAAKVPPPVPPKYRHLIAPATAAMVTEVASAATATYRKENLIIENYHDPSPVTGGALIQTNGTRVKIQINPENPVCENDYHRTVVLRSTSQSNGNAVKININGNENTIVGNLDDMLLKSATSCDGSTEIGLNDQHQSSAASKYINGSANGYFCNISSGQSSPSDNLDSGTCSDVDAGTPPPFGSKQNSTSSKASSSLSVHQRSGSVNSSVSPPAETPSSPDSGQVEFHTYTVDKLADMKLQESNEQFDDQLENTDRFLHFHLNENNFEDEKSKKPTNDDDSFAGFKSITEKNTPAATIRSAKGTVRGVKNRVRAGIATFLNNQTTKMLIECIVQSNSS